MCKQFRYFTEGFQFNRKMLQRSISSPLVEHCLLMIYTNLLFMKFSFEQKNDRIELKRNCRRISDFRRKDQFTNSYDLRTLKLCGHLINISTLDASRFRVFYAAKRLIYDDISKSVYVVLHFINESKLQFWNAYTTFSLSNRQELTFYKKYD